MSNKKEMSSNYVQLSKPFLTAKEIAYLQESNKDLYGDLRNFKLKKKDIFQFLLQLIKILKFPMKVLQNASYLYQRFFLLNDNYKKYSNLHYEIGLTSLFISLKLNDFIKKLSVVLSEANILKNYHLSSLDLEEQKKSVLKLEKKILEFQSFDFRNYLIEDFLIKFLKFFNKDPEVELINKGSCYLSWMILNDLYFTDLSLQFPAHYNALIVLKTTILISNELSSNKLKMDFSDLKLDCLKNDNEFLYLGCNELLEYYIDNFSLTFIKDYLMELNLESDPKIIIDKLINIKIELNSSVPKNGLTSKQRNFNDDLFFKPRDTEIVKTGSIRFMYNKEKYSNELFLYKKNQNQNQ